MPVPPVVPPSLAGRVFRGSDVLARGVLTPAQLRSTVWRRVRQDVYVHASVPMTHRVRVAAVALTMPPGAAVADLSAAALWGVPDLVGPDDPVGVVLPLGLRWSPSSDVRARTADLAGDLVTLGGLPVTDRLRTAVDLTRRRGDEDDRIVLVDRVVRARLVGLDELRAAVPALPRCRGSARARQAVDLADGLAESPQETRTRLLAWPDRKVAVEYDGLWHVEPGQFARDRARLNALQAAGWRVVFVTARDLHHPEELVARVRAALAA